MGLRPWKDNQFNEYGGFSPFRSFGKYEGRIEAKLEWVIDKKGKLVQRWVPDYLRYKSIYSPSWYPRENIMYA